MRGEEFLQAFSDFSSYFGTETSLVFTLLFFTAVIVIFSVFVFYFYKFLAKKNIINLNLSKYNRSESSGLTKLMAFLFYIIEYVIILPIVTFFWFAVLSIFLLVLAKSLSIGAVLIIAAALVAAVRVTSYINQQLSQDLAKMIPLTLLGLSLTDPQFFSFDKFFTNTAQIPELITSIPYYIVFVILLELVMRLFDLITKFFKFGDNINEEKEDPDAENKEN